MHRYTLRQPRLQVLLLLVALAVPGGVLAKEGAHVHGLVKLDVAVDAKTLIVQLEAPLDSLLGFEHRPRTAAQKQAAEAVLKQMKDGAALIRPEAAALCNPTKTTVEADALQPAPPADSKASKTSKTSKEAEHADLDASFEFSCEQPDKLSFIELGLFDAFKRIQKIEVQVAGAKGQSKVTLQRPDKMLKLRR